jgi:multiple sugar transport system substrate-binding protein
MKKEQIKKITAIAVSAVLSVSILTSCGSSGKNKTADGKTIISVGDWPQKEGVDKDNIEESKAKFEAANTDVQVQPDAWKFELKSFYAKAAGGNLPTVYKTNYTEANQIIASEYAADITGALEKYGIADKFNKDILKLVSKDGKIYAFPYAAYALGLAYNVDLMEQAGLMEADGTPKQPKDWDEVAEFAVKIKEATGKPGIAFPTATNYGGWMFTPVAWSYGVSFMEQDSEGKWKATFDSPEAVEALQYIKDLKWKYDVLPSSSIITGDDYYKIFGTSGAGMIIAAGDVPNMLTQYDMKPEQIGMMAMPAGPKKHVTLMGGNLYAVSYKADEDQIDAAVRWIMQGNNPELTDAVKNGSEKEVSKQLDANQLVGVKLMSVWNGNADSKKFSDELIEKSANANINHVKLYNDFMADMGECELRAEEPVCAQELYSILDSCIQEVLENENADCAEVLKKGCSDFQQNYLDNLDY